jgi:tetratricopeptide (TPR) repeat protein
MYSFRPFVSLTTTVVVLAGTALAQRPGTHQNVPDIQNLTIRVVLPDGRSALQGIKVELSDALSMPLGGMVTDQSGEVHFSSLPEGNYQVFVSGSTIEDTSFPFPLYHREVRSLQLVQVKPRRSANGTPLAPGATVPAADLKVPGKALNEFKRGTEALAKQDWEEARKRLEKAIVLYPNYVGAYNNLGVVFMNIGKAEKGRAAFEKAVAIDSNYAPGYVNLARIASSEGKYPEAEDHLKKSVRLNPQNAEALFMLAQVELMNRNYGDAIRDARAVHSLPHHDYAETHYICAVALQANGRIAEASQEYKTFLEEHPEGTEAEQVRQVLQSLEQHSR